MRFASILEFGEKRQLITLCLFLCVEFFLYHEDTETLLYLRVIIQVNIFNFNLIFLILKKC